MKARARERAAQGAPREVQDRGGQPQCSPARPCIASHGESAACSAARLGGTHMAVWQTARDKSRHALIAIVAERDVLLEVGCFLRHCLLHSARVLHRCSRLTWCRVVVCACGCVCMGLSRCPGHCQCVCPVPCCWLPPVLSIGQGMPLPRTHAHARVRCGVRARPHACAESRASPLAHGASHEQKSRVSMHDTRRASTGGT